jgi:hypothetical protein
VTVPKFPTKDPNHRILAHQKSRFTHNYFYIRDEVLGPMIMRAATFFPFQTTYYLNGHSYIEQKLNRASRLLLERLEAVHPEGGERRCATDGSIKSNSFDKSTSTGNTYA